MAAVSPAARVLAITTQAEGERLWKHVLFGTMTCVTMIEGYAELGMPGDCVQGVTILRDRLDRVLNKLKGVTNGQKDAPSPVGSPATAAPSR
jgi:hypothetical protein